MTNKDLTIDDWNPDFNDEESSVWATEWFLPEEGLTPEEIESAYITMIYRGKPVGRWYYTEIKQAIEDKGINQFLKDKNITDANEDEQEELRQFFIHWVEFLKISNDGLTFETEEVNEEIGDEDLREMDEEYAKLGKDSNLVESVKRTLH